MSDDDKAVEGGQIADALRIKAYLEDPAIGAYMRAKEKEIFKDFREADTDEKRRDAWAKSAAFQALVDTTEAIKASGAMAIHQRNTREAAEARRGSASPRK